MKEKDETGIHELYAEDPREAAERLWGRDGLPASRRGFLTKAALAAVSAAVGGRIVFGDRFPSLLIPAALAQTDEPFRLEGKDGLVVLQRVGKTVFIADGVPPEKADAVMKALASAKLIP